MEFSGKNCEVTPENIALLLETNSRLTQETLAQADRIASLEQSLEEARKKIEWFLEQIKLNKQRQFAAKTESSEYLQLSFDWIEPKEEAEPPTTETITYTRDKKTVGRKIDTSKLPREVVIHDLSEEEKSCKQCGKQLEKFGEDRSERLEYIPEQIKVIEHVCNKYTCRCCETVVMASKPEMPMPKSMATPSLITEVIIKKYNHHLPWYRQSKIFAQNGIDIPENTISNWFMQAGEVLLPLEDASYKQLNAIQILQADETKVKVLKDNINGFMWAYHSLDPNNRFIIFEYNDSRGGKVANDTLVNYKGILQTDGYTGYNQLRLNTEIINIGCWAHCRRKFAEVVKLSSKAGKAHEIIKWISKLYQIENEARDKKLNFAERKILRQQQAPPLLEQIQKLLTTSTPLPKSALGKAITYALNQWPYLIRYIEYGEAEIDNNFIENQIRPFALGRNWLFLGNQKSAKIAALFYSLIQTCYLNNMDPRRYLIYVLTQSPKMRRKEVDPKILLPQFIDRSLLA